MIQNITALAPVFADTPKRIEDGAKQFEALLIGQMLRTAREASASDDEDSSASTMFDVADQQFSQLLANNGGMGIAKLIVKNLSANERK